MNNKQAIISQVNQWIESAVIGLDLCPFAKPIYLQNKLRSIVSESSNVDELMVELFQQCQYLIETPEVETTLLIIPHQLQDFSDFNLSLNQVDALINLYRWTGVFQIASFHPDYQFENSDIDDRANWTNRSPFPILHILRESSIERALSGYPDPDQIPEKNIKKLNRMSLIEFNRIFVRS